MKDLAIEVDTWHRERLSEGLEQTEAQTERDKNEKNAHVNALSLRL